MHFLHEYKLYFVWKSDTQHTKLNYYSRFRLSLTLCCNLDKFRFWWVCVCVYVFFISVFVDIRAFRVCVLVSFSFFCFNLYLVCNCLFVYFFLFVNSIWSFLNVKLVCCCCCCWLFVVLFIIYTYREIVSHNTQYNKIHKNNSTKIDKDKKKYSVWKTSFSFSVWCCCWSHTRAPSLSFTFNLSCFFSTDFLSVQFFLLVRRETRRIYNTIRRHSVKDWISENILYVC